MANYLNFTKAVFNPYNPKVLNEGQFSWFTQDSEEQIGSERMNTIDVWMYDNEGNSWYEKEYAGYGEFGGMDYYELLAKMNGYSEEDLRKGQEMRNLGIDLAFKKLKTKDKGRKVLFPALVANGKYNWKRHDFTEEAESDPNQSWYQEDDYDEYDDDYYDESVSEKVEPGEYSGLYYDVAVKVFKKERIKGISTALIDGMLKRAHEDGHLEYTAEYVRDAEKDIRAAIDKIGEDDLRMYAFGASESKVNEKDDAGDHLDKIADIVGGVRDFFAIGKGLDKGGYKGKYFYSDTMMPMYQVEIDGFKFGIINKKYVDKGDREVGNIAIGLMENMNTNMKNEFNLFESFGDFLSSNGILNEAINSVLFRSILMNGKEGKHAKKNMSMLAKGFYGLSKVALDKIEDEDFIVSNDPQKIFKNYGGSNHVIFFISDNEKENPYYDSRNSSWNDYKMVPGGGILLAAMSGDRQFFSNEWSRWAGGRSWSKDKKGDEGQVGINHKYRGWGASGLSNGKRIAEVSDRDIVINLELIRQKYSTEQLRAARKAARAGATSFKSDKEFRDANNARYHKILADKAANLPLDKMVKDASELLAKQISDCLAKGEKTQYQEIKIGESPKGREVKARDASQHMSNILDDYARYVDYIRQAEESEARFGERESYYERESKDYAKRVKEKIDKIEKFDYAW